MSGLRGGSLPEAASEQDRKQVKTGLSPAKHGDSCGPDLSNDSPDAEQHPAPSHPNVILRNSLQNAAAPA